MREEPRCCMKLLDTRISTASAGLGYDDSYLLRKHFISIYLDDRNEQLSDEHLLNLYTALVCFMWR